MIDFILKYYRALSMAIVVVFSLSIIWSLQDKVDDLLLNLAVCEAQKEAVQTKLDEKKNIIASQNVLILANKTEYEENMKRLPERIETIKTRYVAVYTDLKKWEKDSNATDCSGAVDKLNNFNF
jgi:predicted signal transduction protein with EAL and GGDEF domain